jgi:hypothetical protein
VPSEPYGANEALLAWVKEHGWRFAPHAHCLHWVSKGRCGVSICNAGRSDHSWMDHTSGWTRSGERLLLCQPYHFDLSDCRSLLAACDRFGLDARIRADGWYGHGTVCIELKPR